MLGDSCLPRAQRGFPAENREVVIGLLGSQLQSHVLAYGPGFRRRQHGVAVVSATETTSIKRDLYGRKPSVTSESVMDRDVIGHRERCSQPQ